MSVPASPTEVHRTASDELAAAHRRRPHPDPGVVRRQRADGLDAGHHDGPRHPGHLGRHGHHRRHLRDGRVHPAGRQGRSALRQPARVPDRRRHPRRRDAGRRPEREPGDAVRRAGLVRCRHRAHRPGPGRLHRQQLQRQAAGTGDRPPRGRHPRCRCARAAHRRNLRLDDRLALLLRPRRRARRREPAAQLPAQEGRCAAAARHRLDRRHPRRHRHHPAELRLQRPQLVGPRAGHRSGPVRHPRRLARAHPHRARPDRGPGASSSGSARRQAAKLPRIFDLRVLATGSERAVTACMAIMLFVGTAANFLIPLYIQVVQGRSSIQTSFSIIPYTLSIFVASTFVATLYSRFPPRQLARAGFIVVAAALTLLAFTIRNDWGQFLVVLGLILLGLGQGAIVALVFNTLLSAAPKELAGDVGAWRGLVHNLSGSVGIAVISVFAVGVLSGIVATSAEEHPGAPACPHLPGEPRQRQLHHQRAAEGRAVADLGLAAPGRRRPRRQRRRTPARPADLAARPRLPRAAGDHPGRTHARTDARRAARESSSPTIPMRSSTTPSPMPKKTRRLRGFHHPEGQRMTSSAVQDHPGELHGDPVARGRPRRRQ